MAVPINVVAFIDSDNYYHWKVNASIKKYFKQLIEPAPVYSSTKSV